jgi:hypothetical protein
MEVPSLLINPSAVLADFHSLAIVPLIGRHQFDATAAMPVVVPIHKVHNQQANLLLACKWLARVIGPVFDGAEQQL